MTDKARLIESARARGWWLRTEAPYPFAYLLWAISATRVTRRFG